MPQSAATDRIALGLPGIYRLAQPLAPVLADERMDICGFVGIAARGPARQPQLDADMPADFSLVKPDHPLRRSVPVAVESFDDYQRSFGAVDGPGYLGAAVAAFFEQGGRRAYVVRILPAGNDLFEGCASVQMGGFAGGDLALHARNPGSWGARLRVRLTFRRTRLARTDVTTDGQRVAFDSDAGLVAGDFVLVNGENGAFVQRVEMTARERLWGTRLVATLDTALAIADDAVIERVDARLEIDDGIDGGLGSREVFTGLGFSPVHPRWMATILCRDSQLVWPDPDWADTAQRPSLGQAGAVLSVLATFSGGDDAATLAVVPEDMFDMRWISLDDPGEGVHALLDMDDITHVCIPDLYHPVSLVEMPQAPPETGASEFELCLHAPEPENAPLPAPSGLALDAAMPDDLATIVGLQRRLVDLAEQTGRFIALLDAPPGLANARMVDWRGAFTTTWAAAYAPWCVMSGRTNDPAGNGIVNRIIPPSAVAAGIIAASEWERGVPRGPANRVARAIVGVTHTVDRADFGALHQSGINLFSQDSGGVTLQGARTMARSFRARQLSVCRLMMKLRRMLARSMRWAVFEPCGPKLWSDVEAMIDIELRRLWRAGALAGSTAGEAYFIRVDRDRRRLDRGELLVEIGVAPVEPLEFLLVRLSRGGDGTLQVEASP